MPMKVPEKSRIKDGDMGSDARYGNNGAFKLTSIRFTGTIMVICSDKDGWEHVSLSRKDRCPTWDEVCWVKSKFWDDEDAVIQVHPPQSEWINNHPYCLHLWRKAGTNDFYEKPPAYMVGFQTKD